MTLVVRPDTSEQIDGAVRSLVTKLERQGSSIAAEIDDRQLYFRVSVVGNCNLACPFCHNEGAPTKGRLDLEFAEDAIVAAAEVGFRRVQFTGGEPLLHPKIDQFVQAARRHVTDVGITTNGTLLARRIDGLIRSGITRLHISLQAEPLRLAGKDDWWGIPDWLQPTLDAASLGHFQLRLNMPVPADEFSRASRFLRDIAAYGCDLKVFSLLPEGAVASLPYPLHALEELVERENITRHHEGQRGHVFLRGYRPPQGLRCATCVDFPRCREQSHSLRLGADRVLRPCLATRLWDRRLDDGTDLRKEIRIAAVLALDY